MNEFTGDSWDKVDPSDPDSGMTLGQEVLTFRGFGTEYYWWVGPCVSVGGIRVHV